MLPGMTGEELLSRIKDTDAGISVIVSSAKDDVRTRVELLRAGADDYVVNPFDTDELLARLGAVLRRNGQGSQRAGNGKERLTYKDIVMEPEDFSVTVLGQEITYGHTCLTTEMAYNNARLIARPDSYWLES